MSLGILLFLLLIVPMDLISSHMCLKIKNGAQVALLTEDEFFAWQMFFAMAIISQTAIGIIMLLLSIYALTNLQMVWNYGVSALVLIFLALNIELNIIKLSVMKPPSNRTLKPAPFPSPPPEALRQSMIAVAIIMLIALFIAPLK